jgi:hypothetical protein
MNYTSTSKSIKQALNQADLNPSVVGIDLIRGDTQHQQQILGVGRRNLVYNGDLRVWRYHTEPRVNVTGLFADGWRNSGQSATIEPSTDAPAGFSRSIYVHSWDHTVNGFQLNQHVENDRRFADGQTYTVSCWIKADREYSIAYGSAFGNNLAGTTTSIQSNAVVRVSTEWSRVSATFTLHGWRDDYEYLSLYPIGNLAAWAGWDDTTSWVKVTGLQLEAGPVMTPFEHRSTAETLTDCNRFYQETNNWSGVINTDGRLYITIQHPGMYSPPSIGMKGDAIAFNDGNVNNQFAIPQDGTGMTITTQTNDASFIVIDSSLITNSSGSATVYHPVLPRLTQSAFTLQTDF